MPRPPDSFVLRFRDLGTVVDELHARFAAWAEEGTFADILGEYGLYVVQLAVHEWVANLVQHAAFGRRVPEVTLTITTEACGLRCAIEDNSAGFDFQRQLGAQEALLAAPEPSERGRGLLMMIACTEDLLYEPTAEGRQRLAFFVRPPVALEGLSLFPTPGVSDIPPCNPGNGTLPHPAAPVP